MEVLVGRAGKLKKRDAYGSGTLAAVWNLGALLSHRHGHVLTVPYFLVQREVRVGILL